MSETERQLQFMKELEEGGSPPQASPNMSTRGSRSVSPVEIKFMDQEASNKSHKLNGKRRRSEIRRATKLENEQNSELFLAIAAFTSEILRSCCKSFVFCFNSRAGRVTFFPLQDSSNFFLGFFLLTQTRWNARESMQHSTKFCHQGELFKQNCQFFYLCRIDGYGTQNWDGDCYVQVLLFVCVLVTIFSNAIFGSVAGSTKSISRHISLVPEARKSLDNASTSQKLDWIGLQMRVPEYLENMRGVSREAMQNAATASSSFIQHGHRNSLVMNSFDESAPNATNVTLEHQLASKSNMLSLEKRQSLSMMAFPANAKQWLLQSLRLQDSELQKLFNKVKLCVMFLV